MILIIVLQYHADFSIKGGISNVMLRNI